MELKIETAIIGAGLAGAITQFELKAAGYNNSIIFERGYSHGKSSDNYVVYTKSEFAYSGEEIKTRFRKISSGSRPFKSEYTEKLYQRTIDDVVFFGNDADEQEVFTGHAINVPSLFKNLQIYGNIEIKSIDLFHKVMHGTVLHLNKKVSIKYDTLINTIPIYEFAKLAGIDLLNTFGLFISYFPIGIKTARAYEPSEDMLIDYYSDPNIPFYRQHTYKNSISYEYCLNKPFKERFSAVIVPGKFVKLNRDSVHQFYEFCQQSNVFMVGRYAMWNPDFILDNISERGNIKDTSISLHLEALRTGVLK